MSKILVRNFNDSINSKTGMPIPDGKPRRGTPEWHEFEDVLFKALEESDWEVVKQLENPKIPDIDGDFDRYGYVHKTNRDHPKGSLFWMQMHMRDLFTVDRTGWGVDHSDNDPGMFYELGDDEVEWVANLSDELWKENRSKIDQPKEVQCDLDVPFILVPLQVPRDYTILWHSPITVKYFVDSIQAWAHASKTHVAFKLHPCNRCDADLINAVEEAENVSRFCHKVEGSIHEIIKRSAGLFVINSGTGFESLVHGKPVATFGACDYARVTYNADIRRLDEARRFIFDFTEEKEKIARKFAYWYIHEHGFYLKSDLMQDNLKEYITRWTKN